jgi:hypothetical protein
VVAIRFRKHHIKNSGGNLHGLDGFSSWQIFHCRGDNSGKYKYFSKQYGKQHWLGKRAKSQRSDETVVAAH